MNVFLCLKWRIKSWLLKHVLIIIMAAKVINFHFTALLVELDTPNGCGLIERVKQGQSHPAKIYVKRLVFGARSV